MGCKSFLKVDAITEVISGKCRRLGFVVFVIPVSMGVSGLAVYSVESAAQPEVLSNASRIHI